ncbi:hypothetical protein RHMOL_Rhmol12G0110700 [Rhododendron molle]|uniref:Uncharacterized protein n=1 Tax=Rhododendron molle TaxID=49168 RepID=A0ACC0LI14_RHOML|nr:hypothetical protein RHMOL_Rhmol12G0110700 [Rhododendron molle]
MVAAELPSLPQLQLPHLWLTHETLLCSAVNPHGYTVFVNENAQIDLHTRNSGRGHRLRRRQRRNSSGGFPHRSPLT